MSQFIQWKSRVLKSEVKHWHMHVIRISFFFLIDTRVES